jgi:hypothetical protein
MNKYNVWNKWGKLKTVMLGDSYHSEFFKDIKNSRIRSTLQRIADETQEDLEYYKVVLKDFGCAVIRPELDVNDTIMNYVNDNGAVIGNQGVPRSPLQPRDSQLVIGNHLYYSGFDHNSIKKCLDLYNSVDSISWNQLTTIDQHRNERHFSQDYWNIIAGSSWGTYEDYLHDPDYFEKIPDSIKNEIFEYHHWCYHLVAAPSITVIGRDVYIDQHDQKFQQRQINNLTKNIPNVRVNILNHGGHSDSCFHTIKKGAILSLRQIQTYEKTFPDWDVCYLPDQSWDKVEGFLKLKKQVAGKWWVPGEEENNEFTYFVETWLQDWVGYVEETVFDVNVLVLDKHHVCVSNMNSAVIEFLKKHNMEPVHVPWRHRYFWDGGLHCITLDLEREGDQEDYFPERDDAGIIDHGFD